MWKKFKKLITPSWFIFCLLYFITFVISLFAAVHISDEYEGGDLFAEQLAHLFDYFAAPIPLLLDKINYEYSSKYNYIFFVTFLLNLVINALFTTIVLDQIWLFIVKKFKQFISALRTLY